MMDVLFLDLDGTTLNDQKEITPGNRAALQTARASGCRVVVTSGRPFSSAITQAQQLGLAGEGCYVIAYNGAVIYDCTCKQEIFRQTLDLDTLCTVFDEADRRNLHIQTYDDLFVLVEPRCNDHAVQRYCQLAGMEFHIIESVRQLTVPPVKALCIDFECQEGLEAMRQWVNVQLIGRANCLFSSRAYLEVTPPNISKGQAVQTLCRILNVSPQNAVAVGDEVNDISMLQIAGIGAAVQNAVPEVKLVADYVTKRDNNHDAVAEVIYHYL